MKIILIGFMCSGKSSVGKILSSRLHWPHYDTDEIVERRSGSTVSDLIRKHGEGFFRDLEKQAVREVAQIDPCIISTGGGVPLDGDNMAVLKPNSETFWLKVSPSLVMKRAGELSTRPLIDSRRPLDSLRDLLAVRREFYSVARHTINTDLLSPEQVADEILKTVPGLKI